MCTPVRTWLLLSPRFPASLAWQHGLGREGLLLSHSSKHCCNHLTQNRVREEYFRQNVSWLLKFVSWLKLKKFQEIKILLDRLKKINSEKRHRNVNLNVFFFKQWRHFAQRISKLTSSCLPKIWGSWQLKCQPLSSGAGLYCSGVPGGPEILSACNMRRTQP